MGINDFSYNQTRIGSIKALAQTLSLSESELLQLANSSDKYFKVAKRIPKDDGSIRLTYKVIYPLKKIHIRIRNRIIANVEFPDYILAGRRGKSYLDNAVEHKGSAMMLSEDISKFFDSIKINYVIKLFQYFFCFPPDVSRILASLCTHQGHLIQGSSLSGDIANLIFHDKEPKIANLARNLGLKYTRYYDDIYISSVDKPFNEYVAELRTAIYGMFLSVEVEPNKSPKKSRVMQNFSRMDVHDVTVNSHKLPPSKSRTSSVRQQINRFRKKVIDGAPINEIISLYKSTFGKIITLKSQGSPKHAKMLKELNSLVLLVDPVKAKRFARGFRKVKSDKEFRAFANKVSVLKKVNLQVAWVISAESKTAKSRLNKND